ncbi:MAG: DNA translocase FtsK [Clostridia bacterium]|nr:DNA translocase FtsK [Clostridia bacterium]
MFSLFRSQPKAWITPGGEYFRLFRNMADQPHLLVAGATGSGKSVLVRGIIHTLLHDSPSKVRFILIDPKRTELKRYATLPHTLAYTDDGPSMLRALQYAKRITDDRFITMQEQGLTEYNGSDVYVIIDELAALMTTQKKAVLPILQYLGMVARAAHVHIIACTQTVKAEVLPTQLTCNFDSRVALRTSTRQQSRIIVDINGCETFPAPLVAKEAHCFYRCGADITRYRVPYVSESEIASLINWWNTPALCRV